MMEFFNRANGKKNCSFSTNELPEIQRLLDEGEIQGVVVNTPLFSQEEINLVGTLKNLKSLSLHFNKDQDLCLNFARELPLLEEIGVDGVCPVIDFKILSSLKLLIADWNPRIFKNIQYNNLEELHLWGKLNDLRLLNGFLHLKLLLLNGGGFSDLEGLETIEDLEELRLVNLRKLTDLSKLPSSLISLSINKCKKVESYDPIRRCVSLKRLRINDSSPIKDFSFIYSLLNLNSFRFMRTDVISGDLTPLLEIDDVCLSPKKHFSHSLHHFKKNEKEIFDY